jgi:hypothetical protein
MHDEISGWVSTDGDEQPGLLEERWMAYDDRSVGGTTWIDEQGQQKIARKAELVPIQTIVSDKYMTLLPEYYLRGQRLQSNVPVYEYTQFQAQNVPASTLFVTISGNSGLTEEYLYSLLLHQGERRYRILTGSMDVKNTVRIHRCQHPKNSDKLITVHSGEGIHVVRKGKAGHINYLEPDHYTLNDDAYLLVDMGTNCR